LEFSDGSVGDYDLTELISRDTEMVRPLRDPACRADFFVELGAVCWHNGLDLGASSSHRKLNALGLSRRVHAA
jgi:hypothetical protein